MKIALTVMILAGLAGCAGAGRNHCPDGDGWEWVRVLRIVDGDTIEMDFNGDGAISSFGERVRLARIDCPERNDPRNMAAREWLEVHALGERARVRRIGRDTWGRWLCEVELDGENLSDRLLKEGWADVYCDD